MIKKITFFLFFLTFASHGQINSFLKKGDAYNLERKTDSALTYYLKGIDKCKKCSEIFLADYYLKIGKLYKKQENQSKTIAYFFKAEDIYLKENDYSGIVNSKTNLAEYYRSIRKIEKATSLNNESEEIIANHTIKKKVLAFFYNRKAAIIAESSNNLEEVLRLSNIALELSKETKRYDLLLYSYNEIGYIYFRKEKFDLANINYLKALKIANDHNYLIEKCDVLLNIGYAIMVKVFKSMTAPEYGKAELYQEGRGFLKKGLQLAQEIGYLQKVIDISILLYNNSKNTGNYKEAAEYMRIHYDSKELLLKKNNKKELLKIESFYQLKKKDEILKANKDKIKTQYFIIGATLFIALMLLYFFRKSNSDKKNISIQKNKIEEILAQKTVLLKEIHHRVKNNLHLTSSLLYLQSSKHNDVKITEMVNESQKHLNSIALVHEMLYQDDTLSLIAIDKYLKELGNRLLQLSCDNHIRYNTNLEQINLSIDYATTLGLILNELITNSIKHAFKDNRGQISVTFSKINSNMYQFKYSDNGVGLDDHLIKNKTNTLGKNLIKMFAEEIDADLKIKNKNGLTYTFIFKNKYSNE